MAISLEQAAALAAEHSINAAAEQLPLACCLGRRLAEDLQAPGPWPPFARSPLDGYALRAADTEKAREDRPLYLPMQGKLYAGMAAEEALLQGHVFRIMTGAMLPPGADCVLRQEEAEEAAGALILRRALRPGENFVPAGEDFRAGTLLLEKGLCLDAAAISLAAAAGRAALLAEKRVSVALLTTGDELTQPGQPLEKGKIYDTNSVYLGARLAELGAELAFTARAQDTMDALCEGLTAAAGAAQLVVTSGAVSVGEKDLLPAALVQLGAEIIFHGVAIKPGMPTLLARLGSSRVLGLSGNPFAAAVGLELLGRPLLGCPMEKGRALLETPFLKASPSRRFVRAKCRGGRLQLPVSQGNGQMRAMLGCNCLAEIPAGSGPVPAGSELVIYYL